MKVITKCEGKESKEDYSYEIVQMNPQLLEMEQGIKVCDFEKKLASRSVKVQFAVLTRMTQTTKHTQQKLFKDPVQFSFNRYNNILPYEYSMVKLGPDSSDANNYINANYISTVVQDYQFIATQAPLCSTIPNFWRMIFQFDVKIIIMLCNLEENKQPKCHKYWPCTEAEDKKLKIDENFEVQFIQELQIKQNLVFRKFQLKKGSQTKQIIQYHWKGWDDNTAPKEQNYEIIDFLLSVSIQAARGGKKIVSHCSGGIGRTGTLIALFNLIVPLRYFKENQQKIVKQEMKISVFATVRRLREQRWCMVYNLQQYQFIYSFLLREIKKLFDEEMEEGIIIKSNK